MEIKYSIIIPHKNTPELLSRCISTIPDENHIQVIVIDDNSDMDFNKLKNLICSNRTNIEIYRILQNKGAGCARNVGLSYAKGKWILFADSDDYYETGFINILDKYLRPQYDVLYFNVKYNEKDINPVAQNINKMYDKYQNGKIYDDYIKFIKCPWNKVVSKDFLKNNNITFEEIKVGNDAYYSAVIGLTVSSYLIINEGLYHYTYDNSNSISLQKKDFNRFLLYLDVDSRINNLLIKHKKYLYTKDLLDRKTIIKISQDYGRSYVFSYLKIMLSKGILVQEIKCKIIKTYQKITNKTYHLFHK